MSPTVLDQVTTSEQVSLEVTPARFTIREKPPLRCHIGLETPNGRHYRWGQDEPNPANVFQGLRHSSTMPGGYESADCVLPRKPGLDYADLERLSTLTVYDVFGPCGQFRLERAPRSSGNEMSVSPGCVGWQAHLEDEKGISLLIVDRELGRFQGVAAQRHIDLIDDDIPPEAHSVESDLTTGLPSLMQLLPGKWESPTKPRVESWYDLGEGGEVYYDFEAVGDATSATWKRSIGHADDEVATGYAELASLGTSGSGYQAVSKRWLLLLTLYDATPGGTEGGQYGTAWRNMAVIGNHGLTRRGADPGGFFDADIVSHALRYAPLLNWSDETVRPSGFVIPHAVFENTTVGEVVRQSARYSLPDWAVWDDRTFWFTPRGTTGKRWRARNVQLRETGPQVERLWSSIQVQYQDVDGSTRTVGPPGSGADTEDAVLRDDDPLNPANQLGITRRDQLSIGTSTPAGAIEVGRRFLEETKLLDSSGDAEFVGYIEDDRGVLFPTSRVRAGDTVEFVDAGQPGARRIVQASHSYDGRSCSVSLDAPPEHLSATLERLSAVLQPLGF